MVFKVGDDCYFEVAAGGGSLADVASFRATASKLFP